jgi:hypothetical protein
MRMVGVRTLRHADLYSRKAGNPWSVTLGYYNAAYSWNIRDDPTSRLLLT